MKGELYRQVLIPPDQHIDPEMPVEIVVTQEANGCAVWTAYGFHTGTVCHHFGPYVTRDEAIRWAFERALTLDKFVDVDRRDEHQKYPGDAIKTERIR